MLDRLLFRDAARLLHQDKLAVTDLPDLPILDQSERWSEVDVSRLARAVAPLFCAALVLLIVHTLCAFAMPPLVHLVIEVIGDAQIPMISGVGYALALAVASAASWITINHGFVLNDRLVLRLRAALLSAVYNKLLKSRFSHSSTINLVNSDVERATQGAGDLILLIMVVLSLMWGVGYLSFTIGIASMAGIAVLAALALISRHRGHRLDQLGQQAAAASDVRLEQMRDVLRGIRTIKLWRWEKSVHDRVNLARTVEIGAVRRFAMEGALLHALFSASPVVLLAVTFIVQALLGHPLVAADAFAAITVFGLLRPALLALPGLVVGTIEGKVSLDRLLHFLRAPDLTPTVEPAPIGSIRLHNASFCWDDGNTALIAATIAIERGQFVVVTGAVGAGKSALLSAILGELALQSGSLKRGGNIAYAAQEPFLLDASVHDNVVFGRPYDEARLRDALFCAGLEAEALPERVGDRGCRLSGGQRQRLGLARALYGDPDIVVLDDPTSALDEKVAEQVIERSLLGRWSQVTRVVASHRQFLIQRAERVLTVAHGQVSEVPVIPSLFADAIRQPFHDPNTFTDSGVEELDDVVPALSLRLYRTLLTQLLPGLLLPGVVLLFLLREGFSLGSEYWLSIWSEVPLRHSFIVGLCLLGGLASVATAARAFIVAWRGVILGQKVHDRAFIALLKAPMRLFETSSSGALLQRFGRDLRIVDQQLAISVLELTSMLAVILSTAWVVGMATPWAVGFLIPVLVYYYHVQRPYRPANRLLAHVDASYQATLLRFVSETISGLSTIRAYQQQSAMAKRLHELLEPSQRSIYGVALLRSWLSIRLEMVGSLVAGAIALLAVIFRDRIDASLASLAITNALLVTYTFARAVRTWGELETAMMSVARIQLLGEVVPEATGPAKEPLPLTPGLVEFEQVDLRYSDKAPVALNNVSFTAQPGEHIAVMGRTGSGKSTLASALVGMVQNERGQIRIEGNNILELPLHAVRRRIAVIPQEPFLFSGTVRDNLDPNAQWSDHELSEVLDRVTVDIPLTTAIQVGGSNISAGQRQLICLARALLSKASIVVLDEATAHMDRMTELAIRRVLRSELSGVTLITIAHRPEWIEEADRVLMMEEGQLHEVRHPAMEKVRPSWLNFPQKGV